MFADPELAYDAAMREFVRRSAPRTLARAARRQRQGTAKHATRRERREVRRALAARRAQVLQRRWREDAAWQAAGRERHAWLRPALDAGV